jgi:hypothetical protein
MLEYHLKTGPEIGWLKAIQKLDTNCVRKMTIKKLDHSVFEWSLYSDL